MLSEFIPGPEEAYIDVLKLGARWDCHPKTAAKRFKNSGGATLLIGGSVRYPLSTILAIERESVSKFAARKTQIPPQFAQARGHRKKRRKVRIAGERRSSPQ
jgi:hypothetical protein